MRLHADDGTVWEGSGQLLTHTGGGYGLVLFATSPRRETLVSAPFGEDTAGDIQFSQPAFVEFTLGGSALVERLPDPEPQFCVRSSVHGLPSIEVRDPSPALRALLYRALGTLANDPVYALRTRSGAFLQSDTSDYMLIEFWSPAFSPFVDWLNQEAARIPKSSPA